MAGYTAGTVFAHVVPSFAQAQKDIAAEAKRWRATIEQELDDINADVDLRVNGQTLKRTDAELDRAARDRTAHVNVDTDRKGVKATERSLLGLMATAGKLGTVGPAAFAAVGASAAVLPALLSPAIASIGAIGLGLDGIKQAAGSIKPEFDSLKASVSSTFASSLTPMMHELTKVFPVLDQGLRGTALSLSGLANSFITTVTSAKGMNQIKSILGGVNGLLADMAPMVSSFTSGFLELASVGIEALQPLARVMNRFAAAFQKTVSQLASSGALQGAISGFVQVLGSLLNLINPLIGAAVKLMAALGPPLAKAINALKPAIAPLSEALQAMAPVVGRLAVIFATLFADALRMIAPIVKALMPPLLQLVNGVFSALKPILPVITKMVQQVASKLGPLLTPIVQVLVGVAKALVPVIGVVVQYFGSLFKAILPLLPPLIRLAQAILPVLTDFINSVVVPALKFMAKIATTVLAFVLKNILIPAIEWLTKVVKAAGSTWSDIWNGIKHVFSVVKNTIITIIQGIVDGFLWFVGMIIHGAAKAFSWVPGLGPKLKGAAKQFDKFKDNVNKALNRIKDRHVTVSATGKWSNAARTARSGAHIGGFYATGGAVRGPGSGTSDSVPAWLSNGEYVVKAKAVQKYGLSTLRAINAGRFAEGGLIGASTDPGHTGRKGNKWLDAQITAWAKQIGARLRSLIHAAGSGVQRWAPLVSHVLAMLGQSQSWVPTVLRRMNQESGGNPRAVNRWDSNAAAGHPSQGLMQTIPGTFAAYAGPFRGLGILNPLANIYAGLNYALHRYGSLAALNRPGGYAQGTPWVPEDQLAWIHRGEAVIPAGVNALLQSESRVPGLNGFDAMTSSGRGDQYITTNVYPQQSTTEEIGASIARNTSRAIRGLA